MVLVIVHLAQVVVLVGLGFFVLTALRCRGWFCVLLRVTSTATCAWVIG